MKDEDKSKQQLIAELVALREGQSAALLQSQEKFSKAFHCNPDLMSISTCREGRYVDVNDACVEISGYGRHELIGHTAKELHIWADYSQRAHLLQCIKENRRVRGYELDLRIRSGEIRTFCLSGEIIDIDGEPHLLNSSRDITENKRTLEALRFSEDCFAKAFEASPTLMAITSLDEGRIIKVNSALRRILGYNCENLIGLTSFDIGFWVNIDDRSRIQQHILAGRNIVDMEIRFRKKTGEERLGLFSAEPINVYGEECMLVHLTDITDFRQMELEMTRLDQLNLVGEMAASIGHEIRNPMTTVRGYLQLLQHNQKYHDEIEYFNLMIEELDRANSIISEFLSLAKNKMVEFRPHQLNSVLENSLPLMQASATCQDKNIKLEMEKLPDLLLDKKEIQQLILNLVNNGLEAMPPGGCVNIRTFIENDSVVLAVKDQGSGIERNLLDKLGTPFFTTKDNGTGLGLAICYRIANRHQAKIDIETSSAGTTFYVRFPLPEDLEASS
ncbi:MAG: PAS domain S-box protein [Syntrophomonadaceae bacterium]|nr:PAS domain S-box protein [Syntrophomonadaceae bacterium]